MDTEYVTKQLREPSREYLPLKYFVAYILLSLILFLILPVSYSGTRFDILFAFMSGFMVIFIVGYVAGTKRYKGDYFGDNYYEKVTFRILKVFIVISFVLYAWALVERFNYSPVEITLTSVLDFGNTYRNAILLMRQGTLPVLMSVQALTLLSPIVKASIIWGMYFFKKLPLSYRLLWALTLVIYFLHMVLFFATQKQIGDIVIYAFSVAMIRDAKYRTRMKRLLILTILCLVIPLFTYMQFTRAISYGASVTIHPLVTIENNNYLFNMFGYDLGKAILSLGQYVSMGYYGLSLSLQLPFVWTHGIGSSFALMSYAQQYFGVGTVIYDTYPLRMQAATGWPALGYWHTIFPWLASDFTFVGSLIYMGIVAFLYARTWRESLLYDNPLAILVFTNINMLLLFVPANNQLMQTRDSTIAWSITLLLWFILHNAMNRQTQSIQEESGVLGPQSRRYRGPGFEARMPNHLIKARPLKGDG